MSFNEKKHIWISEQIKTDICCTFVKSKNSCSDVKRIMVFAGMSSKTLRAFSVTSLQALNWNFNRVRFYF